MPGEYTRRQASRSGVNPLVRLHISVPHSVILELERIKAEGGLSVSGIASQILERELGRKTPRMTGGV
jgi:hypothetical protein